MNTFTHKCPNCGSYLVFDPKDQRFRCEYCLGAFTEDEVTAYEKAQREAKFDAEDHKKQILEIAADTKSNLESGNIIDLFLCSSCGAEIVTEATIAATYCYYCHNPVVLSKRLSGDFLPEKVLPFAIEREEAIKNFLDWTKKKWFVPRDFFNKQQIDKMTGVYFPYWVVEAEMEGKLNALGTSIRIWRVGDLEYTETKQFAVTREGQISFKELIKNALSKNVQQKMVEGVQPFLLEKAVSFKSQYLSGFQAEKRDIEYQAIEIDVERELQGYAESLLNGTATGYTSLSKVRTDISLEDKQNRYMLLPVWIVTYRSNEQAKKVYYYAMNGQTGKVSGILPVSYKRLGVFTLGLFVILLILFLLGGYFI